MRYFIIFLMTLSGMAVAEDSQPPDKLVFPNKGGEVTFNHAAHLKREKGECGSCHDKLWTKSAKMPVKSSDGCRTCHKAGGASFAMKGNCARCHPAGAAKSNP
jgi:c(7)-type cytochrome triheme protein